MSPRQRLKDSLLALLMLAPSLAVLGTFVIYYGYFALFESLWQGQTPGKRVIGLRTIHASGRPITVFEAILRDG